MLLLRVSRLILSSGNSHNHNEQQLTTVKQACRDEIVIDFLPFSYMFYFRTLSTQTEDFYTLHITPYHITLHTHTHTHTHTHKHTHTNKQTNTHTYTSTHTHTHTHTHTSTHTHTQTNKQTHTHTHTHTHMHMYRNITYHAKKSEVKQNNFSVFT